MWFVRQKGVSSQICFKCGFYEIKEGAEDVEGSGASRIYDAARLNDALLWAGAAVLREENLKEGKETFRSVSSFKISLRR